mmetsp:Transcript_17667/g.53184  ORF Transcript_17667/g.53184 Transcript_17667/m.53184 type:complete len:580 (+) Transcript_17667:92-1831(+)
MERSGSTSAVLNRNSTALKNQMMALSCRSKTHLIIDTDMQCKREQNAWRERPTFVNAGIERGLVERPSVLGFNSDDSDGLPSPVAECRVSFEPRRRPQALHLPPIDATPGHRSPAVDSLDLDENAVAEAAAERRTLRKSRRARTEYVTPVATPQGLLSAGGVEQAVRRSRRVTTEKAKKVVDPEQVAEVPLAAEKAQPRRAASSKKDEALGISLSQVSTPSSMSGSPLVSISGDDQSSSTPDSRQSPSNDSEKRISPTGAAACGGPAGVTGVLRRRCFAAEPEPSPPGAGPGPPEEEAAPLCWKKAVREEEAPLPWKKGAQIGRGSYGSVYRALELGTGRIFAVKEAHGVTAEQMQRVQLELEICQTLRHPNIVSYLGHSYQNNVLFIHLEYVAAGSVADLLRNFGPLLGQVLKKAVLGSLEGLNYLHTRTPPVVHRDIKGANVLVDLDFNMKLADFGCSKCSDETRSFTTIGSIPWMAPEVILQQDGYGRKADIWSFGCLFIEMASGQQPWGAVFDNTMAAMVKIGMTKALPDMPEGASEACVDFIKRCVTRNVEERSWASELLKDAYLVPMANNPMN